ncbi:TetR family transcriptional regulator C-terminal domain-containing protein [Thalassomonas viridans]|uniref:TetR family transcriptional regulator C-terminal domain-containing protein n=1 Tax=Thalassomonas viridans TaxID=137584 RepID=A0AAE9ZF98_9GAMM|nr:TetR/AcrR family transcriptional regulator [Thalassomonas viridans]WDE09002.1 TetR family transcriptional regulator C-terminal domain-containing protein [Thalassomonas viridans]
MARPRRSESTREALIKAGISQLSIYGYHGTGIKQILDEVKVPKGSFYNFFASKEAFVAELIIYYSKDLLAQLNAYFQHQAKDLTPLEKLKAINDLSLVKFADSDFQASCLIATISADIDADNSLCRQALNQAVGDCLQLIAALFEQAQQGGEVRRDIAPEQLAQLYWSTWQGALLRTKVAKDTQETRQCMELLLSTLCSHN